ncbi:MAG: M48 family peptidase [Gammaproteobacteria bacterium]|nr:MAG: M48 family peptidase [Gammaproteobacteria bacterium]
MLPDRFATLLVALSLTVLFSLPASALDLRLPDLGSSAGAIMTPQQEAKLGKAFMRSVRHNQAVLDDPVIDDYIQDLGNRLVEASDAKGSRFHFFVIDNHEINAFAGPGGYIGVYTGLITTTQTESELAAVLAHEIAHVTQKHLLRAWESASNMTIPNAAVLLAAIAIGAVAGGDAGLAAASAGQAAFLQEQINFTRANEQEADRVGIDILARAGFDANAMAAFFSRMGKANRVYATKLPEFLLTHPVTTSRIADALGRAGTHPYHQPKDDLRYHLVKARLALRNETDPLGRARTLKRQLAEGRYQNRIATEYQRALALEQGDRPRAARTILRGLLEHSPDTLEFVYELAWVEQAMGQAEEALALLRKAADRHPASRTLALAHAELAIAQGKPSEAISRLRRYREYAPEEPRVYELLARASGALGDRAEAHRYQAEYHYLNGDLEEAILQLEIALRTKSLDFYESSRLESRLATLRRELKAQKKRE